MPIYARTSGGVYKVISKILTADGNEIGRVVDSTGRIIYEASRLITVTGVPPISFTKSIGKPLTSWSMIGNTQQTGTPSPDNIIMPEFCGVRTAQIIDYTLSERGGIDASGNPVGAANLWRSNTFYEIRGSIVLSFAQYSTLLAVRVNYYDANYTHISREGINVSAASGVSLNIPANAKYFKWTLYASIGTTIDIDFVRQCYIMLNLGSTALPYEPYGYKIPITCAGQTVPVYLGQTQTVRRVKKLVLTGEEIGITKRPSPENSYSIAISKNSWPDSKTGYGMSSHFVRNGTVANLINEEFYVGSTAFSFRLDNCTDATAFRQYLAAQYAAGTPVTVWYVLAEPETTIVNEPLAKIGDYADELHSTDADVTIPTTKGNNTLTVETDLQPSSMTIVYKGKQ